MTMKDPFTLLTQPSALSSQPLTVTITFSLVRPLTVTVAFPSHPASKERKAECPLELAVCSEDKEPALADLIPVLTVKPISATPSCAAGVLVHARGCMALRFGSSAELWVLLLCTHDGWV